MVHGQRTAVTCSFEIHVTIEKDMAWKPTRFKIVAGLVDVRAFDEAGVAFVRKHIGKLAVWVDLEDIEDQLRAMHQMNRTFSAELLITDTQGKDWVATLQDGVFATRPMREAPSIGERLLARAQVQYRRAGAGYTLDRLAQVEAIAALRDSADIAGLIEMLGVANQPTESEQALRRAIYDALSWHQPYDVREMLLAALASEPDEIADFLIEVMHRQDNLDEYPERIDAAWRARDERLAKRLLAVLLKSDDDRKHLAWARASYPALIRKLGVE
jgi:hypothetical protein